MSDPVEQGAPTKKPRLSSDHTDVLPGDDSEDGNLEEDVKLENQLRLAQADLDKVALQELSM